MRNQRQRRKLLWLFAAATVCALVVAEQAALLYALSTVAICALLIVVAFSNLEARDAEMQAAANTKPGEALSPKSSGSAVARRRAA